MIYPFVKGDKKNSSEFQSAEHTGNVHTYINTYCNIIRLLLLYGTLVKNLKPVMFISF